MNRTKDSIKGFMTSFKQFEMKLDKLHDDVKYHGNTLTELRSMVQNLSGVMNRADEVKRPSKRTTAIQYETHRYHLEEPKLRRKGACKGSPPKMKARSFQEQNTKYGLRNELQFKNMQKLSSPTFGKSKDKGDAVRKSAAKVDKKKKYTVKALKLK